MFYRGRKFLEQRKLAKDETDKEKASKQTSSRNKRPSKLRLTTGTRTQTGRRKLTLNKSYSNTNEKLSPLGKGKELITTSTTIKTLSTTKIKTSTTSPTIRTTLSTTTTIPTTTMTTATTSSTITTTTNAATTTIVKNTSEKTKSNTKTIYEINKKINPTISQENISEVLIQDDIFSQETNNLKKSNKTFAEPFLPNLVPLVRKTPSKTLPDEVPIFIAGTKQADDSLEDAKGSFVLPATS